MNASPPPEAVLPTKSLNLATFQNNMSCQKGLATNLATFGLWGDVDTDTKTFYVKVRPQFMILMSSRGSPVLKLETPVLRLCVAVQWSQSLCRPATLQGCKMSRMCTNRPHKNHSFLNLMFSNTFLCTMCISNWGSLTFLR